MDIRYKLIYCCGRKLGQATPSRTAIQQADPKLDMSEYTERFVENQHDLNYDDASAVPRRPSVQRVD